MIAIQSETMIFCLLASIIWAPLVYSITRFFDRDSGPSFSEKLWLMALGLAAAPTLLAPAFETIGLSLRAGSPITMALPARHRDEAGKI